MLIPTSWVYIYISLGIYIRKTVCYLYNQKAISEVDIVNWSVRT